MAIDIPVDQRVSRSLTGVNRVLSNGEWSVGRALLIDALREAGFDVSVLAQMDDATLAPLPPHWLVIYLASGDPYKTPYVVPMEHVSQEMQSALIKCHDRSVSMTDTISDDPELWNAWIRVCLSCEIIDYDTFAEFSDLTAVPQKWQVSADDAKALWNSLHANLALKGGDLLSADLLNRRFVGVTYIYDWM